MKQYITVSDAVAAAKDAFNFGNIGWATST